ncbi:FUSC family protein [Gluconobacter aidae]|uniref:FUSC family protein n=1 Tax=Gluconobacter aidae TaxID=2662454 RepID=A0A7X1SQ44_9PROT|nr:FUSC family protein [Gluconobacter aidae]MQR99106.1 FUSC family protein [Gluconobacter aidae]
MTAALQSVLRPGWLQFSLRTWFALVLALGTAFWSQLDSPASAGVTVMILAQPLRGQALSKAFYRLAGTVLGVSVSIILVAMFNQERALFLGGAALWISACAFVGSLERDFRSYGALLAGYTVALVALPTMDDPQNIYPVSIARASDIAIGVASIAVVNILSGSPEAWRRLSRAMETLSHRVRQTGRSAIMGEPIATPEQMIGLSGEILALMTQISYARTEVERGRLRMAGARLGIIGMLTVLTTSRAIAWLLETGGISDILIRHVRAWHERSEDGTTRLETMDTILDGIRKEDPDFVPSAREAWFFERCSTLLSNRLHIRTGMNTLLRATPAGDALKLAQLESNPDYVTAFINAMRVLLGFSVAAALCLGSSIPASVTALSQTALVLTLASTAIDTAEFGKGAIIGMPAGILVAAWLDFMILPHVESMLSLALVFLPQTVMSCLLLMNPKTSAIGFNYGVFFLVFIGLGNHHNYDPMAFITRNTFYAMAAVLSFVLLVLLWPPTARRHRFRLAVSIAYDLETQLAGHGERMGPPLLSRKYERLSQFLMWTDRMHDPGLRSRRIFNRFVALEDFSSTIARVRHYLDQAGHLHGLRPMVRHVRRLLAHDRLGLLEAEIPELQAMFFERLSDGIREEQSMIINCIGGLEAVRTMVRLNRSAVHHYGIGRKRW